MERFTSVQGRAIPLLVPDIDTDVITPIKRVMQGGDALTRYAFESLRYRADGSPDPECPLNQEAYREAPILLAGANFACGSSRETAVWAVRGLGIRFFRAVLRPILGQPVYDPTSGFVGVNRAALGVFSRSFPLDYPEIEALVVLQRRRFHFEELPCKMFARRSGRSSITAFKSLYYIFHVLMGVFVNVLRYDRRLHGKGDKGG